jgi:hypothetical protein
MKLPFLHTDPDDTRRAAEAAMADTERKIADLERDRAAKLLEPDYAGGVETIDRQIEAQRRAAGVHRDRIAAMVIKVRSDERARLEREKAEHIVETGNRLARRDVAAAKLETALAAVKAAYSELSAADHAIFAGARGLSYLSIDAMPALCRRDRRPQDFNARIIVGPIRAIVEGAADGLAEEIARKGRDLVDSLQAEPVAELDDDDVEQVA